MTQPSEPLSSEAPNPKTMGWMQGFPPPADKAIRFTDPDHFALPKPVAWTRTPCTVRYRSPSR